MGKGSELLKQRWLGRKDEEDREQKEKKLVKSMDSLVELSRHSILSKLNGSKNFEEYVTSEEKKDILKIMEFKSIKEIEAVFDISAQTISNCFHGLIKPRGMLKNCSIFQSIKDF